MIILWKSLRKQLFIEVLPCAITVMERARRVNLMRGWQFTRVRACPAHAVRSRYNVSSRQAEAHFIVGTAKNNDIIKKLFMEKIQNNYKVLVNEKLSTKYWRMVF